ncbi:hypothetical protein DSO57_1020682 [Entomophthora muscae]|uniref:Uncharacterized protein n=1 Tax=Entomophthora muscae TaxID=34485 RepID=A0ACC2U2C0_9FUNG|nr:hypothetical protein DSO57_1020682 [Entomophthora muscae]
MNAGGVGLAACDTFGSLKYGAGYVWLVRNSEGCEWQTPAVRGNLSSEDPAEWGKR